MFSVRSWFALLLILTGTQAAGQDISSLNPTPQETTMSNRSTADAYGHRIEAGSEVKDISSGTEHGLEGTVTDIHPSGLSVTVEWENGRNGDIDQRDIAKQGF